MDKQKKVGPQKKTTKAVKAKVDSIEGGLTFKDLGIQETARRESVVGFSTWVRSLMQNWRQGTVACKGRSDVNMSNKKPWKQKGTGRARAGSARSPLWRGGGVIFGPQERSRTLRVAKDTKKKVLGDVLYGFIESGRISCLDWVSENKPKTSAAFSAIKNAGISSDKLILFVRSDDFLTQASFSNMPNVNMMYFDQPNAFDLVNGNRWVFLKKDFDVFKDMVVRWL